MAVISSSQAFGLLTNVLVKKYNDRTRPQLAFTAMAGKEVSNSALISIAVQRNSKPVAVDVMRGSSGNRNVEAKSTLKMFSPPMYDEYSDITQLQGYDAMVSTTEPTDQVLANIGRLINAENMTNTDKIERAIEFQWASIYKNGKVTIKNGQDIDFKRKAESMVNVGLSDATKFWGGANEDVFGDIKKGCEFIRTKGNAPVVNFNVIMGDKAISKFLEAQKLLSKGDNRNVKLVDINMPADVQGIPSLRWHGRVSIDSFIIDVYSYPETYTDLNGDHKKFWADEYVVVLPDFSFTKNNMVTTFAGLPLYMDDTNGKRIVFESTDFLFFDYINADKRTHNYHVQSAPLAVPVAIDCMYTIQAVAI